jgi:predicted AlkP superfamily phosphohydrolase/phosphomutase
MTRTLIIGLDGATFDLLNPWIQAGDLPTLARLIRDGSSGILHAYPNMNSAVAWSAIVTGCNPGKHGVYDFGDTLGAKDKIWHPVTARDRKRDPFWRMLNAAGQCVSVINVPISFPADAINGFMISGMDAPGIDSPGAAHPPGLIEELRNQGINYVLDVPKLRQFRSRNPNVLPDIVIKMVQARTQTILNLMDRQPWDTFMAVYIATDRMQHSFWGQSPAPCPPDGSPLALSWEPLRQLYKLLDGELAKLLARAGEDTNVLVISDHGFGPSQSDVRKLNRLFEKLGWLQFRQMRKSPMQVWLLKNFLAYGRRFLPPALQYFLAKRFPSLRERALSANNFGDLDWSKTQVFSHTQFGSVFINAEGVWPNGVVKPEDYDIVCEKVCTVLRGLTDPATGRPLAIAVHRRSEVYSGPHAHRAPDIMIEWDRTVQATGMRWEGGEMLISQEPKHQDAWHGSHQSEGILIAHGPQIRLGAPLGRITQYDVAPTVLYLQQQPIPKDMDGRVLIELLDPQLLKQRPLQYTDTNGTLVSTAPELDAAEEAQIESRLRDLGYIE